MNAFVVHHVHEMEDGEEDVKLVGVFSSDEKAKETIALLRLMPGFKDTPECFQIDAYTVDLAYWAEGYVSNTQRQV